MDLNPNTKPVVAPAIPSTEPKRFVRTFASDMEALKAGKDADLKAAPKPIPEPLQAPRAEPAAPGVDLPAAHILPAVPAVRVDTPVPPPLPPPPPAPVLRMAPPPRPSLPVTPPTPPAVISNKGPSPIETYAGDFARRIKDSEASKATILAAEQDAGGAPTALASSDSPHGNILYLSLGGLLLVAGLVGGYVAYTRYVAQNAPVALAPVVSAPIFVDERVQITGTGAELMRAIEQSVTRPLAANAVRLLYADSPTGDSVFTALEFPAPGILLRNTRAEGSMAGVVNTGTTQSPFFIISVASYPETFSGMLAWEVRMPTDLALLFPGKASAILETVTPSVAASTTATGAATTTAKTKAAAATTSLPLSPEVPVLFKDQVIANHDARVYRSASGASIVYGYWDPSTLVIARDAAAFTEIISRLATSRKAR